MKPLTIENITNLAVSQVPQKQKWSDIAINFTFENGITLSTVLLPVGYPDVLIGLYGLYGYVDISTLEELEEFCKHPREYHIEQLKKSNPPFEFERFP
jgi:hypothetical protein